MQDLNDKVTGGSLTATEWNQVPSEIQNVIEALGQTLSSGDLNQLGKAIAGYSVTGDEYTDSGAADAYVLSPTGGKQGIPSYRDGQAFRFTPGNSNTGASTANINGLGVVNIKLPGGTTDPSANMIPAGVPTRLVYRTSPSAHLELRPTLPNVRVLTSSSTYTPTSGANLARVRGIGGGGGGGGVDGQGTGTLASAESGACGGYGEQWIAMGSGYSATYTVGAAGTGGAAGANDGTAGGNSTWADGTLSITLSGGAGGLGKTAASTAWRFNSAGAQGGGASNAQLNIRGANGLCGAVGVVGSAQAATSLSAPNSPLGQGGIGAFTSSGADAGNNASGYGAPGSGAGVFDVTTNAAGGDGAPGVWIVEEFWI